MAETPAHGAFARLARSACFVGAALAAARAPAQDAKPVEKSVFSADRDLAGFEAAQFSDYADLYDFIDYRVLDGEEMTRAELDAVVAKWKADHDRVTKLIAQLATDPALRSKRRLHKRLATHPFLSHLELVENDSFAPVLIVVQRPPKAKPGFDEALAQLHGPWLRKEVAAFEEDWKELLPPRREGCALLPVIFLSSWGDFVNYCGTVSGGAFNGAAHFNSDLNCVVGYAELMGGKRDELVERRGALYGLIHETILSHSPDGSQPSSHWWLREGLARWYSNWSGDAKDPQVAGPDDRGISWTSTWLTAEAERARYFMSVPELLAVKDANDLYGRMSARLDDSEPADVDWGAKVRSAFLIECGLVVSDLMHAEAGSLRPLVTTRLASIVAPGKVVAGVAPTPIDPVATQKRLAATLQSEFRRMKLPVPIDDTLRFSLEKWAPPRAADGPTPAAKADVAKEATGLTGGVRDTPIDPAQLLATPLPFEARIGIALRLAASGEFEAAAASCEQIEKSLEEVDPARARVVRETRRLRELAQWRLAFVEQWKAGGKKLRVDHDGAATTGTVKEVVDGDLVLLDAKGRELEVSLAALDCEQILRRATEAKLEPGTPVVRAYAALIAGRKNWSKGLTGTTPEESALKSEGAAWPALLAKGEAAARLQKLAHQRLPANSTAAAAPLVDLHVLLCTKDSPEVVDPRREMLRKFAAVCLQYQFDAAGIAAAGLKGRVATQPDGTVRITYSFDDPAEAEDWVPVASRLQDRRDVPALRTPRDQYSMKIEKGALRGIGVVTWISKLELAAPMSVTYRYTAISTAAADDIKVVTLCLSLCDDGRTSRIETIDFAGIRATNASPWFVKEDYDPRNYTWDEPYDIRIFHDGTNVLFACHGLPDRKVPCGPRKSGHVGISVCSDAVLAIDELEIEGHVDDKTLAPLRESWVAQQIAALEKDDWKPAKGAKPVK